MICTQLRGLGVNDARRCVAVLTQQLCVDDRAACGRASTPAQRTSDAAARVRPQAATQHAPELAMSRPSSAATAAFASACRSCARWYSVNARCVFSSCCFAKTWRLYAGSASFTPRLSLSYAACAGGVTLLNQALRCARMRRGTAPRTRLTQLLLLRLELPRLALGLRERCLQVVHLAHCAVHLFQRHAHARVHLACARARVMLRTLRARARRVRSARSSRAPPRARRCPCRVRTATAARPATQPPPPAAAAA